MHYKNNNNSGAVTTAVINFTSSVRLSHMYSIAVFKCIFNVSCVHRIICTAQGSETHPSRLLPIVRCSGSQCFFNFKNRLRLLCNIANGLMLTAVNKFINYYVCL